MRDKIEIHTAIFQKQNGEMREMNYVAAADIPVDAFPPRPEGHVARPSKPLAEGMERVWDIDAKGFRILNRTTLQEHSSKNIELTPERRSVIGWL